MRRGSIARFLISIGFGFGLLFLAAYLRFRSVSSEQPPLPRLVRGPIPKGVGPYAPSSEDIPLRFGSLSFAMPRGTQLHLRNRPDSELQTGRGTWGPARFRIQGFFDPKGWLGRQFSGLAQTSQSGGELETKLLGVAAGKGRVLHRAAKQDGSLIKIRFDVSRGPGTPTRSILVATAKQGPTLVLEAEYPTHPSYAARVLRILEEMTLLPPDGGT